MLRRALVVSLSIHILVLATALLVLRGRDLHISRAPEPPPSMHWVVAGDGDSQTSPPQTRKGPKSRAKGSPKGKGESLPSLKDLSLFGSDIAKGARQAPADAREDGESRGASDAYEVAGQMTAEQEAKKLPFHTAIWKRVNSRLGYPNDFVQQRITGQASVQLVLDRRGVFNGEIRDISSNEPMLSTYLLAVLAQSLQDPLPQSAWSEEDRQLVVFRADFDTFGPGGSARNPDFATLKNVLWFRRDAYAEPKLNQEVQKIMTRFIPPIIIVPGAFAIDFIQAYQFVQYWTKDRFKVQEDELRHDRLRMNRREWEKWFVNTKADPATAQRRTAPGQSGPGGSNPPQGR